jgi:hypothetical protein
MRKFGVVGTVALILGIYSTSRMRADEFKHPHPHMLHALYELREAHKELKESKIDFGGHKEDAMRDIHSAAEQIEIALKEDGGIVIPKDFTKGVNYKKYAHHPHLHEALHELKEAHKELKEAKHDFHGHREEALKAVHKAMEQVEILIKASK